MSEDEGAAGREVEVPDDPEKNRREAGENRDTDLEKAIDREWIGSAINPFTDVDPAKAETAEAPREIFARLAENLSDPVEGALDLVTNILLTVKASKIAVRIIVSTDPMTHGRHFPKSAR